MTYRASRTRSFPRRLLRAAGVIGPLALGACSDSDRGDADASTTVDSTTNDAPTATAVVEAGDTLSGIAASHGVTLDELVAANGWSDGADHAIFPGDEIRLPDGASSAAATNRPTTTAAQATATRPSTTAPSATDDASGDEPDEVTYRRLDGYAGPSIDRTDPVSTPLPDGVYWAWDVRAAAGGNSVEFTLSQVFFGDACREVFGTSPEACASDIGSDESAQATVSLVAGTGSASVMFMDSVTSEFTFWEVPTAELVRLVAGDPPSPGAPDGSIWVASPFVVTVRDGEVVAADQMFVS